MLRRRGAGAAGAAGAAAEILNVGMAAAARKPGLTTADTQRSYTSSLRAPPSLMLLTAKKEGQVQQAAARAAQEQRVRRRRAAARAAAPQRGDWRAEAAAPGGSVLLAIARRVRDKMAKFHMNYASVFRDFDKDANACVSKREMMDGIRDVCGMELTLAEANEVFMICDPDGSGELDTGEFLEAIKNTRTPRPGDGEAAAGLARRLEGEARARAREEAARPLMMSWHGRQGGGVLRDPMLPPTPHV